VRLLKLSEAADPDHVRLRADFTQGAAAAEVELDTLTGDHTVLRADIKMDVGRSLNPAIDYGQIEGAFVQGMGWATMEESLHLRNGALFTTGPGAYKVRSLSLSLCLRQRETAR